MNTTIYNLFKPKKLWIAYLAAPNEIYYICKSPYEISTLNFKLISGKHMKDFKSVVAFDNSRFGKKAIQNVVSYVLQKNKKMPKDINGVQLLFGYPQVSEKGNIYIDNGRYEDYDLNTAKNWYKHTV